MSKLYKISTEAKKVDEAIAAKHLVLPLSKIIGVVRNEDGEVLEYLAKGQGSVEAIFNAIDQFFHQEVRLTSYSIDAVTDGIDAQARVLVTVENGATDTIFNASGLDFDVLKASAIAYINANTLVQKENAGEIGHIVSYRDLPDA